MGIVSLQFLQLQASTAGQGCSSRRGAACKMPALLCKPDCIPVPETRRWARARDGSAPPAIDVTFLLQICFVFFFFLFRFGCSLLKSGGQGRSRKRWFLLKRSGCHEMERNPLKGEGGLHPCLCNTLLAAGGARHVASPLYELSELQQTQLLFSGFSKGGIHARLL